MSEQIEQNAIFLVQGTKKRSTISLETKLKIIEDAKSNNNSKLARMYGLKRTTIIEILRVKDKIMQAVDDGYGINRKNLKMRNLRFLIKDFWNGFEEYEARRRRLVEIYFRWGFFITD